MAIRARPVVEVRVYDESVQGPIIYPAYGGRDRIYDLSGRDRDFTEDSKKNLLLFGVNASVLGQAGAGGVLIGGQTYYESVKFIPSPVEAAIAYPLIDRNQPIDLNNFDAVGYATAMWRDGNDGEYFRYADASAVLMYNYYGDVLQSGYVTGLRSRFMYPPNPVICLAILRSDPPAPQLVTTGLATNIEFGAANGCSFILNIPYEYPPTLYVKHPEFTNGKYVRIQAQGGGGPLQLGDPSWRGGSGNNAKQIWIASAAGGIVVSEDCFESVRFFPLRWTDPDPDAPYGFTPVIPASPIQVTHNGGQWALAVLPIHMVQGAIQGPVAKIPYDVTAPWYYTLNMPWLGARYQRVLDYYGAEIMEANIRGAITLNDVQAPDVFSRIPADKKGYEWRATINPWRFTTTSYAGSGLSSAASSAALRQFSTCVSPVLYDVFYAQPAILRVPTVVSSELKEPKSFSIQRGEGELTVTGQVSFDNQIGDERELAQSDHPRQVTAMGYMVDNETPQGLFPETESLRALMAGYGMAQTSVEEGKSELTMDLYGPGRALTDSKKLSDTFPLDGLRVYDAMNFAVAWAGILPAACRFENLGTRLNSGPWDRELYWYTDSGENVLGLMEEMCVYDWNAALWEDEDGYIVKGCSYCRQLRTASDYTTHFGAGAASPGCLAQDITTSLDGSGVHFRFFTGIKYKSLAGTVSENYTNYAEVISIDRPSLDVERGYFNSVRIKGPVYGRNDDSDEIDYTDWKSVSGVTPHPSDWGYSLGYKKTMERTYGWASTVALRRMVAYTLWVQARCRPEYRTIVVPFLPEVRRGNVVQVFGNVADEQGMSSKQYRVVGYSHAPSHTTRERATTLTLKFMRTAPV